MYICTQIITQAMKTLNLKRIVEVSGLKPTDLGVQLFPDHKHPYRAFWRVADGKSNLDSAQIAKLSEILNVPIGLLFEDAEWKMAVPAGSRLIRFTAYDYFAELNLDTMETTISRNNTLFFEKLHHPNGVGLSEYLSSLTNLIIKYKHK